MTTINNENPQWQKEEDEILAVSHQDHLYHSNKIISFIDSSYPGFLLFQTTMLMMTTIPRTRAPPTAAPITIPLSFPLVLFSLSPGPLLVAELEDTEVIMA